MSVVRGRPPGLAGGIRGASRAYCSSLSACPAPKSPTKARFSAVHMACLQEGLLPFPKPPARPLRLIICLDRAGFSNGLLAKVSTNPGEAHGLLVGEAGLVQAAVQARAERGEVGCHRLRLDPALV